MMEGILLDELIETLRTIAEDPAARSYRTRLNGVPGPLLEVVLRVENGQPVVFLHGPGRNPR